MKKYKVIIPRFEYIAIAENENEARLIFAEFLTRERHVMFTVKEDKGMKCEYCKIDMLKRDEIYECQKCGYAIPIKRS